MNAEEYQIALDFVKEFYEKAWTWVLGVIGAGFTITGIIFPLVQNHSNSSRIKKLEKRIDEYEKKVNEYRNDTLDATARFYMLRATVLITQENKMYDDALANFLEALSYFVVLENDKKIRKAFSGITDIVENHTPKPDSYEDGYELKESLNAAITALKEKNRLGKYNEKISYLESLIEESVKRYNEV